MAEKEKTFVIEGKNAVLGRIAAFAAKKALQGYDVAICNCDDVIIVGNPKSIVEHYHVRLGRGGHSQKGIYFPRTTERIMKRTVRGMLPRDKKRGRDAWARVKCYTDTPKEFEEKNKLVIAKKELLRNFITLKELSKLLGK